MVESKKRRGKTDLGYRFISKFQKMPGNIYCPSFYILHHAVSCPYHCSYCYLQNTLRGQTHPRWYSNLDELEADVQKWLVETEEPSSLNTGELADSYAVSTNYIPHTVPHFLNQDKHVLIFLTKMDGYPEDLLEPHPSIRLCWSIQAQEVGRRYETGAPDTLGRLTAAEKAKKNGYNVRIRLDPIIPIANWEKEYVHILRRIIEIRPDFVTLRTLRCQSNLAIWAKKGHANGLNNPFEDVADVLEKDGDDKAVRVMPRLRRRIYEKLGAMLDDAGVQWGLCKETTEMLTNLNKLNHRCNCLP